jgi:WD40 repeat protein
VADRSLAGGFGAHTGPVRSVAFSADGRLLASGSEDRSVLVWDLATGRIVRALPGLSTRVNAVAFGPGGLLFAGDQDGGVRAWRLAGAELAWTRDVIDPVYAFAVSPDGSRLATSPVELAVEDGRPLRVRPSGPLGTAGTLSGSAYGVAYDADGTLLLADQRGSFVLLGNGPTRSGRLEGRTLVTAAFIPRTRDFALGTNEGDVLLLSGETLTEIGVLGRHRARVKGVAASPDGKRVVSCGDDRELLLWDVAARRGLGPVGTHPAPVLAVAFSPDGRHVASGGHDGSVRLHAGRRLLWGRELP